MHGDPDELPIVSLTFAGVKSGPNFDSEPGRRVDDRFRTSDRTGRPVEGGEESIPRSVDLHTLEAAELASDDIPMPIQKIAPSSIAERRRSLSRPHDVGEQYRRQDTVGDRLRRRRAQEPLYLVWHFGSHERSPVNARKRD